MLESEEATLSVTATGLTIYDVVSPDTRFLS